jgi:formate hydrogenlyase subunit 3/multisubunit Na+/H+ antiporter MnhD subunit
MIEHAVAWALLVPLLTAALTSLMAAVARSTRIPQRPAIWLDRLVPAVVCAGLLLEILLVGFAQGDAALSVLGLDLALPPPSRLGLLAANIALLASVLSSWAEGADTPGYSVQPFWTLLAALLTSTLLGAALMAQDRIITALCLFGAALTASAVAVSRPGVVLRHGYDDAERALLARRMAGAIKHLAIAVLGTALLVAGALLISRYAFSLENRALLQLGTGLLSVGLMMRAEATPFSMAMADLVRAAPGVAMMVLGAVVPAVVLSGLLMLAPLEGSLTGGGASWLGALGAVLAGVRALAVVDTARTRNADHAIPTLIAASAALQTAWALFGVLSGSESGAIGAVLLALNMAATVPLLVMCGKPNAADVAGNWRGVGLLVGVASMLGLPPFGGFAGTLMVSQAAAGAGGAWLAVLLSGSTLTAIAWLGLFGARPRQPSAPPYLYGFQLKGWLRAPVRLQVLVLIAVQIILFVASGHVVGMLGAWTGVPWLSLP